MTKDELKSHSGNLRIKTISFDALAQMWEGAIDEYDPKVDEPIAKFYIGKIGKYSEGSYVTNDNFRSASIVVTFSNGFDVKVTADDVETTEEEMTWEEFLPKIVDEQIEKEYKFISLNDEQKSFADRVFLQLIAGQHELTDRPMRILFDQAISMALYRSNKHNRRWDISWIDELSDYE